MTDAWTGHRYYLGTLTERRLQLDRELRAAVSHARDDGMPWSLIGETLGVSKQAAQQRYGSTVEPAADSR